MMQEIKISIISWWSNWKNKCSCCLLCIILLLVWFPWIFQRETHIDTEVLINTPNNTYNWLEIGRQGAVFTKYLFHMQWFNPYFERLAGYLMLCVAGILFGYLFECVSGKNCVINATFGLLCMTAPIMAEQFYFDLQIFEIAWGYVLCVVSAGLSYVSILRKDVRCGIIAIWASIWTFCTYQIFVVLWVVVVVICFVLLYKRWIIEEQREDLHCWKIIGQLITMFAVAFIINTVITNYFFSSSNYLSNQISWKTLSTGECVSNIVTHIREGALGIGTFYTPIYGVLSLLCIGAVLIETCSKKLKLGWLLVLAVTGLQISPFLLTIFMGNVPDVRAQLAYPMVLAGNLLILAHFTEHRRGLQGMVLMITGVLCWSQIQTTERLVYTDEIRAQEDMRIVTAVEQCVNNLSSNRKPIAFIGNYYNKLNESCLRGVLIGRSIFSLGAEATPHYYYSSDRACRVLQSMGIDLQSVSQEQMIEARQLARNMQVWPAAGSVVDAGEFVIVKLSDDQWQEELIELSLKKVSSKEVVIQVVTEDLLTMCVDNVVYQNEELLVNGWAYLNNVNSLTTEPGVFLYDNQTDVFYQLSTVRKRRADVAEVFENSLYEYSGVWASAPIYMLENPLEEYDIYIGIQYNGQWYLRLTEAILSSASNF